MKWFFSHTLPIFVLCMMGVYALGQSLWFHAVIFWTCYFVAGVVLRRLDNE